MEQLWAIGFRLVGRLARPAAAGWRSPGGQRILVLAPHPDDEACGCAGTLLLHRRCGDTICLAYITDGRKSRALGLGPEAMARRRRAEAAASATALGAAREVWFGLAEGEWAPGQLAPGLGELVREFAPDIVYAPSRVDFHPEHYLVALTLGSLLPSLAKAPRLRVYQIQVPLTAALTNIVADISGVAAESTAILHLYATQWGSVARTLRMRRYAAALYGRGRQLEEFWELPAGQYAELHAQPPGGWPPGVFRSLRFYSWSDPLAYLRGRAERRRLAGIAPQTQAPADYTTHGSTFG